MAATIDHLRADHRVHVSRDFTDARGIAHRVGDAGIIRAMGLDMATMEIWIEWDLPTSRERLHFALKSPTGPGNGRMREYFELGEELGERATAKAPPPPPPPTAAPARVARRSNRMHPPVGTNLGDRVVDCECDAELHRPVLVEYAGVNACMRCGTVTCTHSEGDDGRYTGNAWSVRIADAVSDTLLDWLSRWPRVVVRNRGAYRWMTPDALSPRDDIYLPSSARCENVEELRALEQHWEHREPVFPTAEAPPNIPATMQAFGHFAVAARLTPTSELSALIASAIPDSPASGVAVARLRQRADAFEVMIAALRSDDRMWQSAGAAMAYAIRPLDARLPDILTEIINGLSVLPRLDVPERVVCRARAEELLAVIVDQRIATKPMLSALAALQRKLPRVDPDLTRIVGLVLRELHGIPDTRGFGHLP
jgi:hypothetical protein